ncbi:hypothetical protein [Streptodolium elevatio]
MQTLASTTEYELRACALRCTAPNTRNRQTFPATALAAQPEIDVVTQLLTMRLGLHSTLLAARIDLADGLDSAAVDAMSVRLKESIRSAWPHVDQVFLPGRHAGRHRRSAGRTPLPGLARPGDRRPWR